MLAVARLLLLSALIALGIACKSYAALPYVCPPGKAAGLVPQAAPAGGPEKEGGVAYLAWRGCKKRGHYPELLREIV